MFTNTHAEALMDFYRKKDFPSLHQRILMTFEDFNKKVYITLSDTIVKEIDTFLDMFFTLVRQKDFIVGKYVEKYFPYITLLENLSYLSTYKSTVQVLNDLAGSREHEVQKLLLLLNLKNTIDFDLIDNLFLQNSALGSYWLYCVYTRHCFCNEMVSMNLLTLQNRLLTYDLYPFDNINSVYFNATYVNPDNHLLVRRKINETIRKYLPCMQIINQCKEDKKPKIAVLTKNWGKENAVYKCIGAFIESLHDEYELILIQLDPDADCRQLSCFTDVRTICKQGTHLDYTSIVKNDFSMVIYPDIGLNTESLILANIRIAPIQIAMYGHPVSSASDMIDCFFVGDLSEPEDLSQCYTEKTMRMTGTGMNSIKPCIDRPTFHEKISCLDQKTINIFITASPPKINCLIKTCWKKIADESSKNVMFHVLPGDYGMHEVSVLRYELENLINRDRITIHRQKSITDYLDVIKHCDLAIGSYHYGDYNRVLDSLWMGTPIIVVTGRCGYQNTGCGALRAVGLDKLIASDLDDYVSMTLRLISNDEQRKDFQKAILELDIEEIFINNKTYIHDFKKHIDSLLKQVHHS